MFDNIEEYFNLLVTKYNLTNTYNNYLTFLNLYYFSRESFFWIILWAQQSKLEDKKVMLRVVYTVLTILVIALILENIYLKYKTLLSVDINEAHLKYSFETINNCKKSELLKLNLVEQFIDIEAVKQGLDSIINKKKINTVIMVSLITVLLVSRRINVYLVGGLLLVLNGLNIKLQETNVDKEQDLSEDNITTINNIRNYFVESKQKILNNKFNTDFCLSLFKRYHDNNLKLVTIENSVNTFNSLTVLIVTLVVVLNKYKTSSIFDIIVYLLIVYDLDFLVDNIFDLYKINKNFTKYNIHLQNLFKNKNPEYINPLIKGGLYTPFDSKVNSIEIIQLQNAIPSLSSQKIFTLSSGDCILLEGKTGQGKTTFFKFLKNIETPDVLKAKINDTLVYNFGGISDRVYFTIQNNKILYNDNLYNYISNHNSNPDSVLIKKLINIVDMNTIFNGDPNETIDTNKLSGGELCRISLCQTLYEIMSDGYDIILFDEIDVNLDNRTATKIFANICSLLRDKILIFIVHNEELKTYFTKRITIADHVLQPNF